MKLKQITRLKYHYLLGFIFIAVCVVSSGLNSQVAHAWCGENASFDERCVAENYETIPDDDNNPGNGKRGYTYEEYEQLARSCQGGNPEGIDFGTLDSGSCANAASSCIQQSIDVNRCTPDNMATMAYYCANGRMVDTANCDRLNNMQDDAIKEAADAARKSAEDNCTVSGSPTQQFDQRQACMNALNACQTPSGDGNKRYNEYGFQDFNSCLERTLKNSAKDKSECEGRGGVWVENTTGAGGNQVTKGCKTQPSDLVNREACEGTNPGQYEFKVTDAKGPGPGDDVYTCVDKNPPPSEEDPDKPLEGVDGRAPTVPGNCGKARVNLLICGDEGGATAFNNVLRIALLAMTVLVGVAAVGGLAWAAVQYAKAEDNASNASNAKDLIRNIVIGIILYGFLVALINWLVPGGVFGGGSGIGGWFR